MSCIAIDPKFLGQLAAELAKYTAHAGKTCDLTYRVAEQIKIFVGCPTGAFNAPSFEEAAKACLARIAAIYRHNALAYCAHYSEYKLEDFLPARLTIAANPPNWKVEQLIKHLQFVRYQLDMDSYIFKDLNTLVGAIAEKYVESTSEAYTVASWGN